MRHYHGAEGPDGIDIAPMVAAMRFTGRHSFNSGYSASRSRFASRQSYRRSSQIRKVPEAVPDS